MKLRNRFLLAVILAADVMIVFGGLPLLRLTWLALKDHVRDISVLNELLLANLTMLLLVIAAMVACGILGARVLDVIRPRVFARPSPGPQTRLRR